MRYIIYNYHNVYAVASIHHSTRMEQFNTSQSVNQSHISNLNNFDIVITIQHIRNAELHDGASEKINIKNFEHCL